MNKFLDGNKTKLAGLGAILTAIGYFLTESLKDGFQISDLTTLATGIIAGLTVLGLGGKLNKLIEALKK
jgi:hypothetical protein